MTKREANQQSAPRRPLTGRRRILFGVVYSFYVLVIAWLGLYAYGKLRYNASATGEIDTEEVWNAFYEEIEDSGFYREKPSFDDSTFDVLLLGGSVLEQVAPFLETELDERIGGGVRVFNFCKSAHTSRDSALKYEHLPDSEFELVVVYHGINDVRMNCIPEEQFRDDYTHCGWYRSFQKRVTAGKLSLSEIVLDDIGNISIGLGAPSEELLHHGSKIKTRGPFRRNLEQMVSLGKKRSNPVLLMTFAYFMPSDYSLEKFNKRQLAYGRGRYELEVEVWGDPEFVPPTIDAHNEVISSIVDSRGSELHFVDQNQLIPKDGEHFSDICHLTDEGCRRFAKNIADYAVKQFVNSQ